MFVGTPNHQFRVREIKQLWPARMWGLWAGLIAIGEIAIAAQSLALVLSLQKFLHKFKPGTAH